MKMGRMIAEAMMSTKTGPKMEAMQRKKSRNNLFRPP